VILSQIFRGFSQSVKDATSVDCKQLAQAFHEATSVAYRGVTKPTEGTILTVARKVSEEALARAESTTDVTELIQAVVSAAQRAVDETPSQLAVLREAGVVDAGGYGLMIILEGFLKTFKGQPIPDSVPALGQAGPKPSMAQPAAAKVGAHALEAPEEGWGFCTEFLIEKPTEPFVTVREVLTAMGNSSVIVGDDELMRVHIHTLDPGSLIAAATGYGKLQKLKVEDMTRQHHDILAEDVLPVSSNGATPEANGNLGVVAVAVGDGFRRIFEELGASVVEGGQTMNPSTEDLLQAVNAVPAGKVIILPNNKNVIMTAQQVQELCDKEVRVVPSKTVPEGIAALLNLDFSADIDGTIQSMTQSLDDVQTIEVTTAVRSTSVGGVKIKVGDSIAVVNGKIKAAGNSSLEVIDGALDEVQPDGYELLTVYAGAEVDEASLTEAAEHLRGRFPALTVETQRGEQSHYPFILSLE
jgi:DAK2 domain fusion protein YloV